MYTENQHEKQEAAAERKRKRRRGKTDFDGGDAKTASFEDDAYAASSNAFAQPTHHSSCHQHVLHLSQSPFSP